MSLASKLPGLDTFSIDVQRIQAVFTSISVADEVIDKFKLQERYECGHREAARKALWNHCVVATDRRASLVTLTCEDTVPQVAKEIATFFGEVGNRVFARVTSSSTREESRFLEAQVAKARKDVDDASSKLREFQELHKVIDLPEQSKAVISAMASIQGELLSKQLELSYLASFSSRTEANVVQLQQQISIMQAKLKQLEVSQKPDSSATSTGSAGSGQFFPGAMNVPALRYELEQLLRQQKIQETVFFLMTQRYEMAKVDEARNTSTFQILDYPTLPTVKSRPRRKFVISLGLLAGLAVGASLILAPAWLRRRIPKL